MTHAYSLPKISNGAQSYAYFSSSLFSAIEGSPETIAELIVRYLADAGFTVFSKTGKRMQKRSVFIGRHTFCPKCNERGFIRRIAYGMIAQELDSERFVSGGCGIGFNDPEIKCIGCGWEGIPENVRFTKKTGG